MKPNIITISRIIREEVVREEWLNIASKFNHPSNFLNRLHEIDSTQVVMEVPACSSSSYFNYKKTLSIVLMAISNVKYEFKPIYTREAYRKKDSNICDNSALGNTICKNLILLFPTQLRSLDIKIKFHFLTLLWLYS